MQKQTKLIAAFLRALSNPQRLHLVDLLLSGEMNVTELYKKVKYSQPLLSQNLKILRIAGILNSRRENRFVYYFIANKHVSRLFEVANDVIKGEK